MLFTLYLNKLPFRPDFKQIIYVGGDKDDKVTQLVVRNFHFLRDYCESNGYTFCYIPYVIEDLLSKERMHYNAPFAKSKREAEYMMSNDFILDYLVQPEKRAEFTPSFLFYGPKCRDIQAEGAEDIMQGIAISEETFRGNGLRNVLDEIFDEAKPKTDNVRFSIAFKLEDDTSDDKAREEGGKLLREGEKSEEDGAQQSLLPDDATAQYGGLNYQSKKLINEITERLEKLRTIGVESHIIEALFKNHKRRLSRLVITKDYRIVLPDYFGMEIRITPMQKAIYLLFLRHAEGIYIKDLPDYREELKNIFARLYPNGATESWQRTIEKVTTPYDNAINENLSRIRSAFIGQFNDLLAHNYYVTGERLEARRITLPREMVKWETEDL